MDIPIIVPLESDAVPIQVPVTAAEVPVPIGVLDVVAPAGTDELPPHPAITTAKARIIETCHIRMGDSLFELGWRYPPVYRTQDADGR
jgi:hypothetical protein